MPNLGEDHEDRASSDDTERLYDPQWPDGRVDRGLTAAEAIGYARHAGQLSGASLKIPGVGWLPLAELAQADPDYWTPKRLRDRGISWRIKSTRSRRDGTRQARQMAALMQVSLWCILIPGVGWLVLWWLWRRYRDIEEVRCEGRAWIDWAATALVAEGVLAVAWTSAAVWGWTQIELIAEVLGYGTLLVAGWLILKTVVAVNRLLNGVHVADRLLIPAASWIDRRWPGLLGEWGMRNRPAGD